MSDWYWRAIALKAAFALTLFVCSVRAEDTVPKLPYCNPNNEKDSKVFNDLVIVSTLDGRLTAFSTQNGIKAWDLETQPLLSSNLHHVELTSGGKWVRLVPSLSGSLYSLSGDNIEPLPFDAEQLLSSSFKYSDDLVIAGARETLWFGLDATTGGVIYECGSGGCSTEQQTANAGRDVIVLRRHSSTVRALDPRTGSEKWNFSVAEHRVALSRRECADAPAGSAPVAVAVAMPEGVVAIKDISGTKLLWQQKLDAPVAGMWRLHAGTLQNIDVLWEATQTLIQGGVTQQPSLYIGVHDRQLYIQESQFYSRKIETAVSTKPLPWKLVTARPLIGVEPDNEDTALSVHDNDQNALSLITLYGTALNNAGDHGYFVYLQETCDQSVQVTEDTFDLPNISTEQPEHHHIHVHISSLWYWWKEVLLIAVSSALLMNLMIWPRFFAPKIRAVTPLPSSQEQVVVQVWRVNKEGRLPESLSCNDSFSIVFDENAPHSSKPSDFTGRSLAKPDDGDDSFIVFANSGEEVEGRSSSFDKKLERVKECDYKTESSCTGKKKKKGHTRHWSLDMMQLCRRDSLHDWLRENRCCHDRADKVKVLFSQIVSAVEYVHLAGLIHRDLKPSNILFAPDGRVKVGDFGLVTAMSDTSSDGQRTDVVDAHQRHTYRVGTSNVLFAPNGRVKVGDFGLVTAMSDTSSDGQRTDVVDAHQRHTYRVGTHLYMSPEQLLGRPYSYKVDIYSLGLILFELLHPFGTESERVACLLRLRQAIYPDQFSSSYPQETKVLKMMLSEDPSKRPTATGVRAYAPLYQHTNPDHHFTLPTMAAA
ncbi:hypothetical protein B5X24_HaOG208898 [Helicoverpa armigera]|nr:hypothetical protein B5X24_HaOG208898 [Helicoverpa armigera]